MCSIVNQSTARKSDQSEVAISGRLANQKPGIRTNQKAGYKKKQPIDSIETKSSLYEKKRQESKDSHFIQHVTSIKIKRPDQSIEHSVHPDTRGSATGSLSSNVRQKSDPSIEHSGQSTPRRWKITHRMEWQ